MDNPQHYQPLSHALQPPLPQPSQYSTFPATNTAQQYSVSDTQREEEEEEEEEEVVEEELDDNDHRELSPSASPQNKQVGGPAATGNPAPQEQPPQIPSVAQSSAHGPDSPEQKRRPGRPKGSRNRKPRESAGSAGKSQFPSYPISQGGAPPLPGVTAQNQQFYEFQWRVLNLCSEFYGAAEELIKATPAVVIAQSYQMGPSSKVDPLSMLNEAKRICDQLLQNPSQLVGQPPPPVFPPASYPPPSQTTTPAPATTPSQPQPSVITNPSTFVMPLGMPGTSQPIYPTMYAANAPRYPTAPYYQYPHAPGYYPGMPPQSAPPAASSSAPPTTQLISSTPAATTSTLTMATSNPAGASGAWADEEVERLRRLAGQSRNSGSSTETDWDWVVGQWGNTRTRHQILLKATALGLKESTTRGVKRRREGEAPSTSEATPAPAPPMNALTNPAGAVPSPAQSQTTTSTPSAQPSPAIHNPAAPPQPQSTTSTPTLTPSRPTTTAPPSNMPWPMPTVAANTSPVIAAAATVAAQSDQRGANYYRQPRTHPPPPAPPVKAVPPTSHQFVYQPNGKPGK